MGCEEPTEPPTAEVLRKVEELITDARTSHLIDRPTRVAALLDVPYPQVLGAYQELGIEWPPRPHGDYLTI